ncbi:transporter substrate-binding domain-containing protein [Desulfobaculum bizertense]|uniref:Polar amino acid transport system substrate-binding protein n=1 Tax=Desulfobaculum bizertense DSM 18034 TaxID=1121442 RepID=A0A1T4VF72_9BACT|nr:transporter substrate-binding domain-containing protein [Desulfobaculum bizertense]SKA63577.1 polar amino acid transport system substrate-binding protein [Desulfobaculum bizertense DSM 18034]
MRKLHTLAIALFAAAFLLVSTAPAQAGKLGRQLTEESTLTTILKRGTLRVGMDTFVPWAMKDKTGKFIGFEIDVARRLAEDMGVDIEFVPTSWDGIIPALLAGKFDLLIGGMGIRADRAVKVNFSIPYYSTGMSIVANSKKIPGATKLEDFNKEDIVISARKGTTAAKAAKRFMPNAKLRLFNKEPQAVQELLNGRAHAFISMAPLPAQEAIKHKDKLYLPMTGNFTNEPNGIAMRKGDVDMLNFVNSWIRATKAEGWILDRQKYWFTTLDWQSQVQ